jgi:hypothetical protein
MVSAELIDKVKQTFTARPGTVKKIKDLPLLSQLHPLP